MAGAATAAESAKPLQVWAADPLNKVFQDALPSTEMATADEARGQTATFQIVVRARSELTNLRCEAGSFANEDPGNTPAINGAKVRYVGYVFVDRPLAVSPKDRVRKPPAYFPDPLFDEAPATVKAGDAQPIWITLKIPLDCMPGSYHAQARITAQANEGELTQSIPLSLKVYGARVEHTRLWVTNWFQCGTGFNPMPVEYSPEFWQMLRLYARDMAAHRQTVARTVPLELAQYKFDAAGNISSIDWSRMDQWVQIFIDEGVIGRIEGQQIAWRAGKWKSPYVVSVYVPAKASNAQSDFSGNPFGLTQRGVKEVRVSPASEAAARFYSRFLPLLQQHVKEKGWLKIWMQHVGDEPDGFNSASYQQVAVLVKKYAPDLRRMDAILTPKAATSMEVMTPLLNVLHDHWKLFHQVQSSGEELWFYTCGNPQGEYANRELEMSLIKVRLIPWIDFRYGVTGYLHWGYNFWSKTTNYQEQMKLVYGTGRPDALPGDPWIVYPKLNGLGVNDSIRWEAQRDGCEDHELLSQLAEKDSALAHRLAERTIQDFNRYDTNIADFRQTCREMLEALSKPMKSEARNKTKSAPIHKETGISMRLEVVGSGEPLMSSFGLNPATATALVGMALWRIEDDI